MKTDSEINITWGGRDLSVTGLLQINPPIFWPHNQPGNMVTVWGLSSWVDFGLPTPLDLTFGDFRCRNRLRFACSSDRLPVTATSKSGPISAPKIAKSEI